MQHRLKNHLVGFILYLDYKNKDIVPTIIILLLT